MAKPLVSDELWAVIDPLLPPEPPKPRGGRPRIPDCAVLTGILFVLKSGIPWQMLPQELGCGNGMTCWRRLRDWNEAGVWKRLHEVLLSPSRGWRPTGLESSGCGCPEHPSRKKGAHTGPNPDA